MSVEKFVIFFGILMAVVVMFSAAYVGTVTKPHLSDRQLDEIQEKLPLGVTIRRKGEDDE